MVQIYECINVSVTEEKKKKQLDVHAPRNSIVFYLKMVFSYMQTLSSDAWFGSGDYFEAGLVVRTLRIYSLSD